jgi:hypothetical protein
MMQTFAARPLPQPGPWACTRDRDQRLLWRRLSDEELRAIDLVILDIKALRRISMCALRALKFGR